ncbi:MAG: GntP family permease [Brevinemataceae bacterium]
MTSTIGVLLGLTITIILVIRHYNPVYSMFIGAFIGGILSGHSVPYTIVLMIDGIKDMIPGIARILSAGVLVGVLVKTGAAVRISETIIEKLGEKHIISSVTISACILCAIGVFINVAVFTVAPIALLLSKKFKISKTALLIALSGGAKAGNIISPNSVVIAGAQGFGTTIPSIMFVSFIPAIIGIFTTIIVSNRLKNLEDYETSSIEYNETTELPSFLQSIIGPAISIILLALKPLADIDIDPMISLPLGGIIGLLAMKKTKKLQLSLNYGLEKMSGVSIMLIGTGTLAGVMKASQLTETLIAMLEYSNISHKFLGSVSGLIMAGATGSSTAGTTITASAFAETILYSGIAPVWAAALTITASTVLDHMPHGSLFHNSSAAMNISLASRLKSMPGETLVGIALAVSAIILMILTTQQI